MMRLRELINGIYTQPVPAHFQDVEVQSISSDSREEQKDGLFVALPGSKFNGEDFIKEAISKGARVIVKLSNPDGIPASAIGGIRRGGNAGNQINGAPIKTFGDGVSENVCVLDVDDPKSFLHRIGPRFYGTPSDKIKSIGITGTNGKTTVSYLIESIILSAVKRCGIIGTINHRIGPKTVPSKNTTPGFLDNQRYLAEMVELGIEYCVMEASSHALDQGRLEGINFSAGIFTNLTQDHLDYHKDMDNYFKAKSLLIKGLLPTAFAIINVDDQCGKILLSMTNSKVMTYAIDRPSDIRAQNINYRLNGSDFEIAMPKGRVKINTRFIGKHNIYNILAAFTWGLSQNFAVDTIRRGIESLTFVPGRLQAVENDKGISVFIDYAHTEDGLFNVLNALKAVSPEKIILVFGCGGNRDRTKRPKMAQAACVLADYSIVTSDNPRQEDPQAIIDEVTAGFTRNNYEICVDRREAIGRALNMAKKDQIVLIAGKGHEDYQVFNNNTVAFNERDIVKECLKSKKS